MRALGLDLGEQRIGVAIGDGEGRVATPLTLLERSGDWAVDHRAVLALVAEWGVEVVVVGMPYSLDGTCGSAARSVADEIVQLDIVLDVPVTIHDERLTTVTAERSLAEQGLTGRRRRTLVDQVAASVILQAWLDFQREEEG